MTLVTTCIQMNIHHNYHNINTCILEFQDLIKHRTVTEPDVTTVSQIAYVHSH